MDIPKTFNRGDEVPVSGEYVCVPCGFHRELTNGEHFPECISCFAGTEEGEERYVEGLEMWEKTNVAAEQEEEV